MVSIVYCREQANRAKDNSEIALGCSFDVCVPLYSSAVFTDVRAVCVFDVHHTHDLLV